MARTVKPWLDEVGSGTDLEAPTVGDETVVDAAALRDMETRDGAYVDEQAALEVTNRNGAIAAHSANTTAHGIPATVAAAVATEATARTAGDAARQLTSEKGAANGYAGLGSDGKVPAGQLPPQAAQSGSVTKRVSTPIAADGANGSASFASEFCQRLLVALPVTTTRWRLRIRNYDCAIANAANAGALAITGVWSAAAGFTGGAIWDGRFAAAPAQALAAFATPADGSDFTTDWVTDAALQWAPGIPRVLSYGCTTGGASFTRGGQGGWFEYGAGKAARADDAGAFGTDGLAVLDVRLEYEFETAAVGGVGVGVFIGDSITAGYSTSPAPGVAVHETWPGQAGMRGGFCWVNLAIGGAQASSFSAGTGWRWDRVDLATTVPDFAVIANGSNDASNAVSAGTFASNTGGIIDKLRALGVGRIYLATGLPRDFDSGSVMELARLAINGYIRTMPGGVAGVLDHDKILRLESDPTVVDTDYMAAYPHPTHAGFNRMADPAASLW